MTEEVVYIVGAARTPIGNFNGGLASVSAAELGSVALREALARGSVQADQVDEVFMGQILAAGRFSIIKLCIRVHCNFHASSIYPLFRIP